MKGKPTLETNVSKLEFLRQKRLFETIVFRTNEKQTFQLGTVQSYLFQPKTIVNKRFVEQFVSAPKTMFPKQMFSQKQTNKLVEKGLFGV